MDLVTTFQHMAVALGLGLLVGLQRERASSRLAGIRTFPLITMLGTTCAALATELGGWVVGAGLLALVALLVVGNVSRPPRDAKTGGLTTEVAALLMFAIGAYLVVGHLEVALALGGGVAVLLQLKQPLHRFVARIGDEDIKAIMQFALIALVILPALPNETFGPLNVFNPRQVWLFVVLIVAISLIGYVAYKLFGARAGAVAGGVLGGLISSTATAISYARLSRKAPQQSMLAAMVITIASAIVFGRVLVLLAVVAPALLPSAVGPVASMGAMLALMAVVLWWWTRNHEPGMPTQRNPTELKSAIVFGALYTAVVFGVAAAKHWLGDRGLYLVAAWSGLTDMDAITLSTAQMAKGEQLAAGLVWRLVLVASMANLVFKGATAAALGNRRLAGILAAVFGVALIFGASLLLLWPRGA